MASDSVIDDIESRIGEIEQALGSVEPDLTLIRSHLRDALCVHLDSSAKGLSLADVIIKLSEFPKPCPQEAGLLLRVISENGIVSFAKGANVERAILAIVERSLPDVVRWHNLESKRQTYEKFEELSTTHRRVAEVLVPFSSLPSDLDAVVSARQMLTRALNDGLVKAYGAPFKIAEVRAGLDAVSNKLARVLKEPTTLAADLMECTATIEEQKAFCAEKLNFITYQNYVKFLDSALAALKSFSVKVRGRFQAPIVFRSIEGGALQKRYPFREQGRKIRLSIPLNNGGPGIASNVRVKIEADPEKLLFSTEELLLGNVGAGDFSAVFEAEVMRPFDVIDLMASVTWNEAGLSETNRLEFLTQAAAQRADIDWSAQEYKRPYSTDVAKGDNFVGRADKVRTLANKMLRTPMESFYVTGQKRVGKTSLALAAVEFAKKNAPTPGIEYKYLLWGTIANANPEASMRALGENISAMIIGSFPRDVDVPELSFDGSLAPIVGLAELAEKVCPGLKYIIIIDEFDEIHPELYQHGNLAETFFANIRAITTCENVGIVLVGGENMPFVMDRQGQKLNKLVRVPLDYFSRDTEWGDFKLLVSSPSEDVLDWHDEAISEVFNITNGNPFFAKIVCSAVFENCVSERDSDVTAQEVTSAIAAQVPTFDTIAFAHLWQDGIHKPLSERDPDILRRCRTLVLLSRALRRSVPLSLDNILLQKEGIPISDTEVLPVINDFEGRSILTENAGKYDFVLPIFKSWLAEIGGGRLIADALGEELARSVQSAEDAAFVRSDEVVTLVKEWPTYQGQAINADDVRAWFEQADGHQQQRLLFKILQHTKVYSEIEIREKLQSLHSTIRSSLPEFVTRKKSDRRTDVFVTYADGEGKSGQYYGARYADVNRISVKSIINPFHFSDKVKELIDGGTIPAAIVFLDDIIGTGRSLSRNLRSFVAANESTLKEMDVPVTVLSLAVTVEGEQLVRSAMEEFPWLNFDLRFSDLISADQGAFSETSSIWSNDAERSRAKALCEDLGATIYRDNPLGFGKQGLLTVFPVNCPNNSLPILHSPSRDDSPKVWKPLFARSIH